VPETDDEISGWFSGRLPEDWFTGPPEVRVDRDEILVVGKLPEPEIAADATSEAKESAVTARIDGFREDTRARRMRIASEAERRFRKKVSWGAEVGDVRKTFTSLSLPMMTRLRMEEREVLDTLVDAGVARSRSHALAWCVRLVSKHQGDWIKDLRDAFARVEQVRSEGPE
jgi:hypothetical protein